MSGMSEYSILHRLRRADIRYEPYVHVIVEECLPPHLFAELADTYPSDETILRLERSSTSGGPRPNSRHDVGALRILHSPHDFSETWREFVNYHVSHAFFQELLALLGPELAAAHPGLEQRLGRPLHSLTTGVRYDPQTQHRDIALDCHIGINTPSAHRSSVRRVHSDAPDELFAALFYFRAGDDEISGGDLQIYRWKAGRVPLFVGSEVDEIDAELVCTVPCKPNTAVIFINSEWSLHAVSARAPSVASRRLVNVMGRVPHSIPEGLFKKRQKTDLWSLGRRLLHRYGVTTNRF
jgi:hypothetical protein